MKSKNVFRKPVKSIAYDSDELRKAKKLKPVKKEKNARHSLLHEIDDDEGLDLDLRNSGVDDEDDDEEE